MSTALRNPVRSQRWMASRIAGVTLTLGVVGSAGYLPAASPAMIPARAGSHATIIVRTNLVSKGKLTESVGSLTYGLLHRVDSHPTGAIYVNFLASVYYHNGNGPWTGFARIQFSRTSSIVVRMSGMTTTALSGAMSLHASLRVIAGTGTYSAATGTGVFEGTRTSVLTSPLQGVFDLHVRTVK